LPAAIAAGHLSNIHLLWLALTLFMALRAFILAIEIPQTLRG
jgi:multidrug resistance protein, MATE family